MTIDPILLEVVRNRLTAIVDRRPVPLMGGYFLLYVGMAALSGLLGWPLARRGADRCLGL